MAQETQAVPPKDASGDSAAADAFDKAFDDITAQPAASAEQNPDVESGGDAGAPDLAVVIATPAAAPDAAEEAAESPAEQKAEGAAGEALESPDGSTKLKGDGKDEDRLKSWEGRLKVLEAELKAREEALKASPESPAEEASESPTAEQAETEFAQAVSEIAKAETPEEIKAIQEKYAGDFGPDFVDDLMKLIGFASEERFGPMRKEFGSRLDGLQHGVQSALQSMHESAISDAHPDLQDIVGSPQFAEWIKSLPNDKKAAAIEVLQRGMWPQVIRLIKTYKDAQAEAESAKKPAEEPAAQEAAPEEADPFADAPVSTPASANVRMPDKAEGDDSYEATFSRFK